MVPDLFAVALEIEAEREKGRTRERVSELLEFLFRASFDPSFFDDETTKKTKKTVPPTSLGNRRLIAASPLARHPYFACESSRSEGDVTPRAAARRAAVEKSECLESKDSMKRTLERSRAASSAALATESLVPWSRMASDPDSEACRGCT